MRQKKGIIAIIVGLIIYLLWLFITYYLMLPPINVHAPSFWSYLFFIVLLPLLIVSAIQSAALTINRRHVHFERETLTLFPKIILGCMGAIIVIALVGNIAGAKFFNANRYASVLGVEDVEFTQDIDQASALNKIALMDTNSAIRLGNREIGSLSELVSQYNVSENYSQIDINGSPVKVTALDYAGFFKWLGNKSDGIPGYVTVDPVGQDAEYVSLEEGMKYVPSAYFNKKLDRHLRFCYPTAIFGNTHFEVDEEGNPYYVASVYEYTIGLFGGETVGGVIVCDPVTGDCDYYDVDEIPTWVDVAFDGELLTRQYNWTGELGNGFWNSLFGKKGCKKCTETAGSGEGNYVADYGYISKDGDIWIYTGVTSVNDDASNIGFILVNQRTSEAHFYTIAGADENSAMSAAEGEVQEKGYDASFPSLINVDEQPTYVMVLKDGSGIVKLYAMVNVESYNIVTTAADLDDCFAKYKKLIKTGGEAEDEENGEDEPEASDDTKDESDEKLGEKETREFTIEKINYIDVNGNTYVYLYGNDQTIYRQKFVDNEALITLNPGDTISVEARKGDSGVYQMEKIVKGE